MRPLAWTASRRVLAGVIVATTVVLTACGGGGSGPRPGRPDGAAPVIDAPSIVEGERVRSADFVGRGYLVNFWGSWCEPCKRELPRLVGASATGTAIVGVAVRDSDRRARAALSEVGATWPSASDPEAAIAATWGVAAGFPVTVAVDRSGTVRKRHIGELSDADLADLVALIR